MIEVKSVTKRFGRITAVDDISFDVRKGEILGFLGPNGAGKTTTMRILTCFIPPTEGTVSVAGHDIFKEPLQIKRKIGYLPETPPIYPEMTVIEYLNFVARIKGLSGSRRIKQVEKVFETCAITDVRDQLAGRLSKGYRQRVGLAQALVHDPEILILDEPTAGLDPKQIIETRELIKGLAGQHTIILSTHILPEVSMTCERVVIINRGRVVAEDTPEALTLRLQGTQVLSITVDGPEESVRGLIGAQSGVAKVEVEVQSGKNGARTYRIETTEGQDIRRELAARIVEQGYGLLELKQSSLSLEDIYLQLTTSEETVAEDREGETDSSEATRQGASEPPSQQTDVEQVTSPHEGT
jgi:ABC-2 type transport system ATP-binding protein